MMDEQNAAFIDLSGRVLALGFLVTRLVADHALRSPDKLCASWLNNIDEVVDSMDITLEPGPLLDALKIYLRHNLETAQRAVDLGTSSNQG